MGKTMISSNAELKNFLSENNYFKHAIIEKISKDAERNSINLEISPLKFIGHTGQYKEKFSIRIGNVLNISKIQDILNLINPIEISSIKTNTKNNCLSIHIEAERSEFNFDIDFKNLTYEKQTI
jgi:hypothetical protein